MAIFVRELNDWEARKLQQTLRRSRSRPAWMRAQIILASAQGFRMQAIAQLLRLCEKTVRETIHGFNNKALLILERRCSPGRPAKFSEDDKWSIIEIATSRSRGLGLPFSRWSLSKLRHYLTTMTSRRPSASSGCDAAPHRHPTSIIICMMKRAGGLCWSWLLGVKMGVCRTGQILFLRATGVSAESQFTAIT